MGIKNYFWNKRRKLSYLSRAISEQSYEMGKVYEELLTIRKGLILNGNLKQAFDYSWQKDSLYAHAMGAADGIAYTNSKEAFLQNYRKGCRVFETDISLTKEGLPVLCHDWRQIDENRFIPYSEAVREIPEQKPMEYARFMRVRFNDAYTPLDLNGLVMLAKEYSDAYFIVSVKSLHYIYDETVRARFALLEMLCRTQGVGIWERMIPQAHSPVYFYKMMADFSFHSVIYGMRDIQIPLEQLTSFLQETGIKAVACDHGKPFTNTHTFEAIHKVGAQVIVATVNKTKEMREWEEKGADAFLTDLGFPEGDGNNEKTL